MGKEDAGTVGQVIKRGRGRPRGANNPTNNPTSGDVAGIDDTTSSGGGSEEIEVIRSVVDGGLTDGQIPTPEKAGRGRPKGSTKSAPSKKPAGKKHDTEQTKFMVQTLLSVAFNVSASRLGDHWKLSAMEAEALADPITAIMERHDLTEKTGAYGDYIALIAAIGMIIVPKVLAHGDIKKKRGGIKLVQKSQQSNGNGGGNPQATPLPDAGSDEGSHPPVQQRDTLNPPSDVKRSLAWFG